MAKEKGKFLYSYYPNIKFMKTFFSVSFVYSFSLYFEMNSLLWKWNSNYRKLEFKPENDPTPITAYDIFRSAHNDILWPLHNTMTITGRYGTPSRSKYI